MTPPTLKIALYIHICLDSYIVSVVKTLKEFNKRYEVHSTCLANKADSEHKVVAMTADEASDMDAAAKKLHILKHGCLANIFNPAAQKIYTVITVSLYCIVFIYRDSVQFLT